jgi:hypothetical protein
MLVQKGGFFVCEMSINDQLRARAAPSSNFICCTQRTLVYRLLMLVPVPNTRRRSRLWRGHRRKVVNWSRSTGRAHSFGPGQLVRLLRQPVLPPFLIQRGGGIYFRVPDHGRLGPSQLVDGGRPPLSADGSPLEETGPPL